MTNDTTASVRKIVLVGGCFDVLHFGHIQFLEAAKRLGNFLIVALESDENVRTRKGEHRPIHTQQQREHMLESLTVVDQVLLLPFMSSDSDYHTMVSTIRPSIIAVTEGDPYVSQKKFQALEIGAEVIVIPKTHTPSTSQLAKLIGLE